MGRLIDADERVAAAREQHAADATGTDTRSDGGTVELDGWPESADPRSALSEKAVAVVELAAVRKDARHTDIADQLDISQSHVSGVLRAFYPERTTCSSGVLQDDDRIDRLRQELVHGRTNTRELRESLDHTAVRALPVRLRCELYGTLPPIEYEYTASQEGEWRAKFGTIPEPGDTPHPAEEFDGRLGRLDATTNPATDDPGLADLETTAANEPPMPMPEQDDGSDEPGLLGRTIARVRGLLP